MSISAEICCDLSRPAEIRWDLLWFPEICWNMSKSKYVYLPKFVEICRNLPKLAETCWDLVLFWRICRDSRDFGRAEILSRLAKFCQDQPRSTEICWDGWNLPKPVKICWDLAWCAEIWLKFAKMCWDLVKICEDVLRFGWNLPRCAEIWLKLAENCRDLVEICQDRDLVEICQDRDLVEIGQYGDLVEICRDLVPPLGLTLANAAYPGCPNLVEFCRDTKICRKTLNLPGFAINFRDLRRFGGEICRDLPLSICCNLWKFAEKWKSENFDRCGVYGITPPTTSTRENPAWGTWKTAFVPPVAGSDPGTQFWLSNRA